MKNNLYNFTIILSVFSTIFLGSCSKSPDVAGKGDGTTGVVEFNLNSSEFERGANLGNRAATQDVEPELFLNTLDIGNDMLLISELSEDYPNDKNQQAELRGNGAKAAIERTDLPEGVRYRVVAFNPDGSLKAQQEYIRGSETATMLLDGGVTYTFIVYSRNSTTLAVPAPSFSGPQTLANASVTFPGNADVMYFRQELTVVGGEDPNRLNIILKHLNCQITTTIDATQTGYDISNVNMSFGPHLPSSSLKLEDGVITRSGTTNRSQTSATFTPAPTQSVTSIVSANANTATDLRIASLTVGQLTLNDLLAFENLPVTPGVKYNLLIRLVPTDELLIHEGRPAARINGVIWARHNLGADPTLDPDAAPMDITRHGDYYQYGRVVRSGAPNANIANPFFASNDQPHNAWNSGTEDFPVKTAADPCPSGYRVPARREQASLIQGTIHSNMGPFVGGNSRFDSAKILVSKRDISVRLTLPSQGFLDATGNGAPYNNAGIVNRGFTGHYHNSNALAGRRASWMVLNNSNIYTIDAGNSHPGEIRGRNIRCVGM
ncbi:MULTISPECIES: hypothetical protein [Sphingobacterium]|uniref:Fibrobacter succinogenes major paralogous domain-containing protein n=1 Tax=Sphingobacterium populi TaxID=1812824 RepID=A0ABW5UFZ3_9SPHI|nr:hypothetical protein [Sphingobacterium sp. CFCC 11742]